MKGINCWSWVPVVTASCKQAKNAGQPLIAVQALIEVQAHCKFHHHAYQLAANCSGNGIQPGLQLLLLGRDAKVVLLHVGGPQLIRPWRRDWCHRYYVHSKF